MKRFFINEKDKNNLPIRLDREDVVLRYDHIVSSTNSKQKAVKMNQKLEERLATDVGRRVEGAGDGSGFRKKIDTSISLEDISCSSVKSGLKRYRQCGIERPNYVRAGGSLYYKGSNKKWKKLVQNIGMEVTKGNNPMNL